MAGPAGSLAARLRWARSEQAITLQQLSERCGRAVSYLSQLEHGVRENPTKETIDALAGALGVRPAFLFGEVPSPPFDDRGEILVRGQAWSVNGRFRAYWEGLPVAMRESYAMDSPEERFRLVIRFLLEELPDHFNRVEIAWQLGMSLKYLDEMMAGRVEVSTEYMQQLSRVTGVPESFLLRASMIEEVLPDSEASRQQAYHLTAWVKALHMAERKGITPEQLEALLDQMPDAAGGD